MKGKRVMNTVTKVAAASVIAVCAQGLCAAEITWGGSSGRWHTKSNWIGGEKPAAGDSVVFPAEDPNFLGSSFKMGAAITAAPIGIFLLFSNASAY